MTLLIAELRWPEGSPSGAPYSSRERKGNPWLSWLAVMLAGATHDDGGGDGVAQHGGQTPNIWDLQPWFTMHLFDIGYPCYAQLTPVNLRYPLTSITCHIAGSGLELIEVTCFLEVDRWPSAWFFFFFWIAGSCRVKLFKTGPSCPYCQPRIKI